VRWRHSDRSGREGLVQRLARSVDAAELAAAFEVGLDNVRDLLGRAFLALERNERNRQLRQPDARHLDPELGQRRKHGSGSKSRNEGAACK
jgi:hypothetical protein